MNTSTYIANPLIALDCPACDGTILVDQLDLGGAIECQSCLVAFELSGAAAGSTPLEAIAA